MANQAPSCTTDSEPQPVSSMVQLADEFTQLSALYPGQIRTDFNITNFLAGLTYIPCLDRKDESVQFLVKRGYPSILPEIDILSNCLEISDIENLKSLLLDKGVAQKGQRMLQTLIQEVDVNFASIYLFGPSAESQKLKDHATFETSDCKKAVNGKSKSKKEKRKNRRRRNLESEESDDDYLNEEHGGCQISEASCLSESVLIPRDKAGTLLLKPTHFIAIRITDVSVLEELGEIQQCLATKEPLLSKGVFALNTLHLTVCTLGLDTPLQVTHCKQTMESLRLQLLSKWPQQPLAIHSMGQFYNRAIYAKVKCGQDFLDFRNELRLLLHKSGVEIRDEHASFTPHVTIVKVKRTERKMFGSRNIKPSLYSHVLDRTFGRQLVEGISLCCMGGERREDGFYVTDWELQPHNDAI